jgi:RNA polymerase II subunit A-like phosphatase
MVVAIDDRADVWKWSPNLIKVRPYNFFLGIGDINEPAKEGETAKCQATDASINASLIPTKVSESGQVPREKPTMVDDDDDLKYVRRTMTSLHANFYNRVDRGELGADVCNILPWMKSRVLEDVHIAFSGIIPIGYDPLKNDLWIQATQFGAKCYTEMNASITHLIARKVI